MRRLIASIGLLMVAGLCFALPRSAFDSQWRVATSGGGGESWTPSNDTLTAWYDASDLSTITTNASSQCTIWEDKSGSGRKFIESSYPPYFSPSSGNWGGLPALTFGGNNTRFRTSSTYEYAPTNTAGTVFAVYDYDLTTFNNFDGLVTEGVGGQGFFSATTADGAKSWYNWGQTVGTNIWIDGVQTMTHTVLNTQHISAGVDSTPYPITLKLQVGKDRDSASRIWDGDIVEIIIYPVALSSAYRQRVEGYLAWKWGIQDILPAGHPYKASAPTVD